MATIVSVNLDVEALNDVGMRGAQNLVSEVTRRTLNRATVLAPVDTGRLRSSGDMRVKRGSKKVVGEVIFDVNYAAAVHEGSRPHTIRARKRKSLRFVVGGQVIYAKAVHHPGTRPRPFLRTALEEEAGRENFVVTPR